MSAKHFENFLVTCLQEGFHELAEPGHRYQFRSPNEENSAKLHSAFCSVCDTQIHAGDVILKAFTIKSLKVVPLMHSDDASKGFSENYISYLRDEVAGQHDEFDNTVLVTIHNSNLDTIINSATDLAENGMPFNVAQIKNNLDKYASTHLDGNTRNISRTLLNYQLEDIGSGSMFSFEPIFNAFSGGGIDFKKLDLLPDPMIEQMDGNDSQIEKRLEENKKLFQEVSHVVEHYPEQLADYLPDIGDQFIDKHFSADDHDAWKDVELDKFLKEQESNRKPNLQFQSITSLTGEISARTKSTSKSSLRDQHILLLADDGQETFDIEILFTGSKISKNDVKIKNSAVLNIDCVTVSGGTKQSKIQVVAPVSSEPIFFTIALDRRNSSEKFNFKCLVVRSATFNLKAIKPFYVIKPHRTIDKCSVLLRTPDTSITFSDKGTTQLSENDQTLDLQVLGTLDFTQVADENDSVSFGLSSGVHFIRFEVEGASATDTLELPYIHSQQMRSDLFSGDNDGVYNSSKQRVYIDNREYKVSGSQLTFLKRERECIDKRILGKTGDHTILIDEVTELNANLGKAYDQLFDYFSRQSSLPSLAAWGDKYQEIIRSIVYHYAEHINSISYDQTIQGDNRTLVNIGWFCDADSEWISPFSPLVLAYYLDVAEKFSDQGLNEYRDLPKVTLKRFSAQGLLPYIFDKDNEFSYVQASLLNPMWMKVVPNSETSYSYVSKLVKEKVSEFSNAFRVLFETPKSGVLPTLTINSINNFSNTELFQGLVEHIASLREKTFNIHVNVYNDAIEMTEFDTFTQLSSYEKIKQRYGLTKGKSAEHSDLIVDLLRTRVSFSKFQNNQEHQYAHISFYRNNEKVGTSLVDPSKRLSGILADGLVSGEASISKQGSYYTGFGCEHTDITVSHCLRIAPTLNRLIAPSRDPSINYQPNSSITLMVNDNFRSQLEKCYKSSIWTTVIDPKVTLSFFESDADMLLIHYSDQYTSSSGYDAITVTKQTRLYDQVLSTVKGSIVSEFNAFNGEWLLKLITDNENIRKERKGIIAAYKLVTLLLAKSDFTWVPMSAAELIRVSGNIGLKIDEQDFATHLNGKTKGPISDDVLFVGFRGAELAILPLEVKTGKSYDASKAVTQAIELKTYISQLLFDGNALNTSKQVYRALFVRQALMQVDKFELYDVFPDGYFDDLRRNQSFWLRGCYDVVEFNDYHDGFVVANLEADKCYSTNTELVNNILKIEVPSSFMDPTIGTSLRKLLLDSTVSAASKIEERFFLDKDAKTSLFIRDNGDQGEVHSIEDVDTEPASFSEEGEAQTRPFISKKIDELESLANQEDITKAELQLILEELNQRKGKLRNQQLTSLIYNKISEIPIEPASNQNTDESSTDIHDGELKDNEKQKSAQVYISKDNSPLQSNKTPDISSRQGNDNLSVLIGHDVNHQKALYWEPTNTSKYMNTNSGIIGTMGTGKTQCTKSVVTQLIREQHNNVDGKPIGILIFDYKSDYVDDQFGQATDSKKYNLYRLPYNPLSLFGDLPMLPVHTARGFSETMARAFNLGQKQQLKLRKLVGDAYDLAGIHKADASTWTKPAPTVADIWQLFLNEEPEQDSLYAALESLSELEVFEPISSECTSLYELINGVTVIELAGYPGQIQNLVVALTLDLFYSQMQKQGKPIVKGDFRQVTKLILVDEADNFMKEDFPSLRKILKEGREYGVGLILSTQDITHFKTRENDYSKYILSWIVHRVASIKPQDIKSIFNEADKSDQERLMEEIAKLEKHHSLYVDGAKTITKIKDRAFWELTDT